MKVLNIGLMVSPVKPLKGLEKELNLISEYKSIPLQVPDLDKTILKTAKDFKPDLIFFQLQKADIVSIDTFRALHDTGIKIINWTGDVRTPIPQFYFDVAPYCITSFSNMTDVNDMRNYGYNSKYLQIGYDPEVFFRKPAIEKDIDIVFMGNNYREHKFPLSKMRIDMVEVMKKEFGDRFKVYGNGWKYKDGSCNGDQNEENDIYNRSKIGINLSHFNYSRYSSDRMFRLMGSGCFCLTHTYDDIALDFPMNTIGVWDDFDDLIDKCHNYLKEDIARQTIADRGYDFVNNKYSYKNMAQNILRL